MKTELIITEDGSHTLFVPELDEHYHSIHGSVQEAKHVYIQAGLAQFSQPKVTIFEVGLGTALNCILSYQYALEQDIQLTYHCVEKFPIANEISEALNYSSFLSADEQQVFQKIHAQTWNEEIQTAENLLLKKIETDLTKSTPEGNFDLIYFDAFGPTKQSEMWSVEIFEKMFRILKPEGILVTYSAKGDVKRALRAAGFTIKRIPGPPGKRQMVRATKPNIVEEAI